MFNSFKGKLLNILAGLRGIKHGSTPCPRSVSQCVLNTVKQERITERC
jgi:hypothetical protein